MLNSCKWKGSYLIPSAYQENWPRYAQIKYSTRVPGGNFTRGKWLNVKFSQQLGLLAVRSLVPFKNRPCVFAWRLQIIIPEEQANYCKLI